MTAAAAAARLALVAAALLTSGCGGDGEPAASGGRPFAKLGPGWSALTAPPAAREWAARAWTGRELLLWGGSSRSDAKLHAGGFAYTARSGRWRRIAAGPLSARRSVAAAWTGAELLIWGGLAAKRLGDGASFAPRSGDWRALPASPLSPREPAVSVWTGKELVIWGDASRSSRARDGAAYDPARRRWRRLPAAPFALNQARAAWTGREMAVIGALLDGRNRSAHEGARALAYDPRRDRWRRLPASRLSPQASSIALTGSELVAWDYELRARALRPGAGAWRRLPRVPAEFGECHPETVRAGGRLLAWYCGRGALYSHGRWAATAPAPRSAGGPPIAAGRAALFASVAGRPALWAYRPAAD